MQIFIDADAFPNVIREILIKASLRLNVPLIFVANKPLRLEGFELSAHGLEVRCSIQLSYRRIFQTLTNS